MEICGIIDFLNDDDDNDDNYLLLGKKSTEFINY